MKKFFAGKNKTPFTAGIDELLNNSIYILYSKSNGKVWNEFPREDIPDLIFCDSRLPLSGEQKTNPDADKQGNATLVPFIYFSTNVKINNKSVGIFMSADDYMIKQFSCAEMFKTIENNIENNKEFSKCVSKSIKRIDCRPPIQNYNEDDRIFIDSKRKPKIFKVGDILFITSKGNDSVINLLDISSMPIRKTLNSWEDILPMNMFKRINRSTIINLKFVERISRWTGESYIIYLQNIKEPFAVSHRYAREMRSEFK